MVEKIDLVPSQPDELRELIADVCAVMGRIILLAPPDQQRDICVFVAREINEMLEQVLHGDNTTSH
jgi:hypothetical protein